MGYSPLEGVPFSVDQLAVAVTRGGFNGGHSGLAFHHGVHGPQVLHLAWHKKLLLEAVPEAVSSSCWVAAPLSLPPSASKQIVAYVRTVAGMMPTIDYGTNFLASIGSFSHDGSYTPPAGSKGLTCASFVVEVLRGGKVNLVDESTWESNGLNVQWANSVCDYLARYDPVHAEAVRRDINGVRLIPFEVAGAASNSYASWPIDYTTAQQLAPTVAAELCASCPSQ